MQLRCLEILGFLLIGTDFGFEFGCLHYFTQLFWTLALEVLYAHDRKNYGWALHVWNYALSTFYSISSLSFWLSWMSFLLMWKYFAKLSFSLSYLLKSIEHNLWKLIFLTISQVFVYSTFNYEFIHGLWDMVYEILTLLTHILCYLWK